MRDPSRAQAMRIGHEAHRRTQCGEQHACHLARAPPRRLALENLRLPNHSLPCNQLPTCIGSLVCTH